MLLRKAPSAAGNQFVAYGFVADGYTGIPRRPVIDAHHEKISPRSLQIIAASVSGDAHTEALDAYFWLPAASETLNISRNLKDYVIVPDVPTIVSDIPNTNGVAFPRDELFKWNHKAGRMSYKTFKGKPCYQEHDNTDLRKACGVILDCYLTKCPLGIGLVQLVKLLAIDRNKYPDLAKAVMNGEKNCYSMGAYFSGFEMSDRSRPTHDSMRQPLKLNEHGELVYKMVHDPDGFETSVVSNPAWAQATNTQAIIF